MPNSPKRPCQFAGCADLVAGRFCPKHQKANWKAIDSHRGSASSRGYGAAWQRLRAVVLRDEPLCRECDAYGVVRAATEVDHIIPRGRGGTDARSNLQPLCKPCHSAKTMRESVAPPTR
jgi:5-methylcytosine-specific restriction protein A